MNRRECSYEFLFAPYGVIFPYTNISITCIKQAHGMQINTTIKHFILKNILITSKKEYRDGKLTWGNKQQAIIKLIHQAEFWYTFIGIFMIVETVEQGCFLVIPNSKTTERSVNKNRRLSKWSLRFNYGK